MIYFIGASELYDNSLYAKAGLNDCIDWLQSPLVIEVCLDTETEGMFNHKNKIVMLQLYNEATDTCFVIDARTADISKLAPYLSTKLIIGQNLKFDYKFLKLHGITLASIYDTFLAECILTTGLETRALGLAALASKYCDISLDKSVRNQFVNLNGRPFTDKQIVYGIGDVTCLPAIKQKQLAKIESLDLLNVLNLENRACIVFAEIEYVGMKLDAEKWKQLALEAENKLPIFEVELDKLVRDDSRLSHFVKTRVQGNLFVDVEEGFTHERDIAIKWSSPQQVLNVLKKLEPSIESSDAKELNKFKHIPIVTKLLDYKKYSKLITTYGESFLKYINPITKRVHTNFFQILNTGRVSSGDSNKESRAPNMQNLPADVRYRNCFIPEPGNSIVSCDFSGQELRLVAFVSQEPTWLTAFNLGRDLHSEVAAMVFNVPIEKVKDKPDFLRGKSYRDVAKTINFGLVYGMSEFKLAKTLSISEKDAKLMIDKYFENLPKLNEFLKTASNYGKQHLMIRTCKPFRRIRFFDDPKGDFKLLGSIERASKNTVIQGSGADMCKLALVKIHEYILQHNLSSKVRIIMTVHDQIDCEVVSDFAEQWAAIQKCLMEEAGEEIISGIPVLSEVTISDCWTK